jgi:hypothetical protein
MILRKIYLFLILLSLSGSVFSVKDSCLKITDTQWEKISKDKDYTETYADFDTKEKGDANSSSTNVKSPSFDLGGLKYLFYLLVAAGILFVIVKILMNINSSPSINIDNDRVYTLSEVEEKILEIDLEKILNEALLAGDYRLALRINFLIIIKTLSLRGKIKWAKEKTNWEYFNEIKDYTTASGFKDIISTFEPIWYGEYVVSEELFNKLQPSYEWFKKTLNQQ